MTATHLIAVGTTLLYFHTVVVAALIVWDHLS